MKIPRKFTIYDLRFTIGRSAGRRLADRRSKDGIALVITLIMLAVTLVMMVAFMALARRETKSVGTTTDNTVARLATDTAMQNAEAQIAANFLSGFTGVDSSNAYSFGMIVSTNYINPIGYDQNPVGTFTYGSPSPTNVNYDYTRANVALTADQRNQTISNLWFLPRAPVFFPTNQPVTGYDFRYYLDLNENGRFETNGWGPVFSGIPATPYYDTASGDLMNTNPWPTGYIPPNVASTFNVGDPEWIGVLEHPDQPHGPNNHFTSRYAFIAVPVGNDLDVNYIGNEARNTTLNFADGFMRNQGVGSWEINLAAFLADLNTNSWSARPLPDATYYSYNEPFNYNNNSGYAFQDAMALLKYRYYNNITKTYSLPSAGSTLFNAPLVFPYDGIDAYSDGPLQTTLDTNMDLTAPNNDGDQKAGTRPWPGADNPNHFFTPSDFLDASKVNIGAPSTLNSFTNRLRNPDPNFPDRTYNRYTFYRMLQELGIDSAADDGKLNLNYSNAVVTYANANGAPGVSIPVSVGVVVGAETNLVPWTPQNFFIAAADKLLRLYTAEWFQRDPSNYLATYYGYNTRGYYVDATGLGVTNFPNYGVINQIPAFGLTNIPVMINGNFVYSPAVNRLLQLAANLYDASTNNNFNFPHVYRPIFERDAVGNLFIVGYTNLYSGNGPNTINGLNDPQLNPPFTPQQITNYNKINSPIFASPGGGRIAGLVNVYGVPWIIGAKKGFPSFNQLSLVTAAQVTRKLEVTRSSLDPAAARYGTNQEYVIGVSNTVGVTFWNSFSNDYVSPFGNPLTVVASDVASTVLTNQYVYPSPWQLITNFTTTTTIARWPGSKWSGTPPAATPQNPSFLQITWPYIVWPSLPYDQVSHNFFQVSAWEPITQNPQMDHFGILITNYLQAYILDGNYVLDYVHFRDPIAQGDLNQALADPNYPDPFNPGIYYQWSTNAYQNAIPPNTPDGIINQIWVSGHNINAPTVGSVGWLPLPTPMGTSPPAEAAYFGGFFTPTFQYLGKIYANHQLVTQAPYTPSRAVYTSYLMQANDPLVHYLASDLNSQVGTLATWAGQQQVYNGFWYHSDDLSRQPLPTAPTSPIGGRYQPWGLAGQMAALSRVDTNQWNLAYKDPLAWGPDYWDFPTNAYPSVGWIGRVHRGSPWQTVDLKSTNILWFTQSLGNQGLLPTGSNTWAAWTGDIQQDLSGHYYDAANSAPMEDRLLFDIFTTRFNDNAARGTLPVNVGVGTLDGGLAAWSALFSGMEVLSNLAPVVRGSQVDPVYSNLMINPAGVDVRNSVLAQIVASINTTRANANVFPYHGFTHAGDVLQASALSEFSPFLNIKILKPADIINYKYGVGDEAYEWLPQQMMGLVRGSEQRYVLYCFGQTLHPAPNGTVLSGTFFQLVTNYQVTAESAARAVIRVDNANTSKARIVIESYNTLPPN